MLRSLVDRKNSDGVRRCTLINARYILGRGLVGKVPHLGCGDREFEPPRSSQRACSHTYAACPGGEGAVLKTVGLWLAGSNPVRCAIWVGSEVAKRFGL